MRDSLIAGAETLAPFTIAKSGHKMVLCTCRVLDSAAQALLAGRAGDSRRGRAGPRFVAAEPRRLRPGADR